MARLQDDNVYGQELLAAYECFVDFLFKERQTMYYSVGWMPLDINHYVLAAHGSLVAGLDLEVCS